MEMTKTKPTGEGWYWFSLKGSWALQPALVFLKDEKLFYNLGAIPEMPDKRIYGMELDKVSDIALWGDRIDYA